MTKKNDLDLKQQIGQMIVVRASGHLFDHQIRYPRWEAPNATLENWLKNLNLGGVILLGGSAAEISYRTQQLQSWSPNPLLFCADIEEGAGQRFTGATFFGPPMSLGAIAKKSLTKATEYAYKMGAITAKEALSMGINWILAPLADVNNNYNNPVINIRAFSDDPQIVGHLVRAFIAGAHSYPILTTAKHFPGHGDTSTDSHLELPIIKHDNDRLESLELPPFQEAIDQGVDAIMTAHLQIPAWDAHNPATLSPAILTGQLRQKMGFDGLIVTDALIMGGVSKGATPEEIAVKAVIAGADILLMPDDPIVAIESIYEAVKGGIITQSRIESSFTRIQRAKQKLSPATGLNLWQEVGQLEALETVNSITIDALESGGDLPVKGVSQGRNLIVVDDLLNSDFLDRTSPAVILPQQLGYELQLLDRTTLPLLTPQSLPTLLQVFIRGNPFRGSAGLTPQLQEVYKPLLESGYIKGIVVYGSPYIVDWFKVQVSSQLPWVFSYSQTHTAQRVALESLFGTSPQSAIAFDVFV
ncbi:MAG: Beta-hexosaminidase [Chroococcopsis gigantea SAG 12.99]|jgi:beta-glucosidase|nr:beta-glucosidase [Chlorogloea purpurea SAG 13.99]MDV3002331.1 Beta-hexosaminidase [Chroococcopsis gigantea SAG 12.99]